MYFLIAFVCSIFAISFFKNKFRFVILLFVIASLFTACDPIPGRTLSADEKAADMAWLFTVFGENYAPLEYKEKLYGFKRDELNKKYLQEAVATTTNEDFYLVMNKYVAEFHDAHTSLTLTPSDIRGRARIAYLGFSGARSGNAYWVRELLPTMKGGSYPIKPGDLITHVNGQAILDYVDKEILPYRNLGNPESNRTVLINAAFTRVSLSMPIPKEDYVNLTVKRGVKSFNVRVPWIHQDIVDFKAHQAAAAGQPQASAKNVEVTLQDPYTKQYSKVTLIDQTGRAITYKDLVTNFNNSKSFFDRFKFSYVAGWTTLLADGQNQSAFNKLKLIRAVPEGAIPVEGATDFPAYMAPVDVKDAYGQPTGKKAYYGYIRISDFEPQGEDPLGEFNRTLVTFQKMGVKHLVLDTLDNPGGSLEVAMKMAQLLSPTKIEMPKMQFGVDDMWIDNLEHMSLENTNNDAEREIFSRLATELKAERSRGLKLSEPISSENLMPFQLDGNSNLVYAFDIITLVNEGNASCGDIFPLILKENQVSKIYGKTTMGAGGNVVDFRQAPNSHADVRQTMSLIVKKDGTYLENTGVDPDVKYDTRRAYNSSGGKYGDVLRFVENEIAKQSDTTARLPDLAKDVKSDDKKEGQSLGPSSSLAECAHLLGEDPMGTD